MKLSSVPAKFFSIHWSIRRLISGPKWFFQSPVLPVAKFRIQYHFNISTLVNLPLRMNRPSRFMNPSSLQNSLLTASFLVKLSMRRCLTICVSCPSLRYLPKNFAIFSNSPRKFYSFFSKTKNCGICHNKFFKDSVSEIKITLLRSS